jgi:uncharacterized membrane protein
MRDYKIAEMILFPIGYMLLSVLFALVHTNFIGIWLGINVILAVIPMLLITLAYKRLEKAEFKFDWMTICLLIVFVFFFPNTFYVITDLIHIDQSQFYINEIGQQTEYLRDIADYIFLFHVLITVAIGVYAGVKSMLRFNNILEKSKVDKGTRLTFLYVLVLLSSVGIYIGRFLRFFSWDVLNPFNLLTEFYHSIDFFALVFFGLFSVIQLTLYYGYRYFYEEEPF